MNRSSVGASLVKSIAVTVAPAYSRIANLRVRIAALDGRHKRREPPAKVLRRCQHAGGRPNRIDEKGDKERLGRRPHIEHVAHRPILAHDQVAWTEVSDWPASFSDDGNQRGLLHDILPRRRSQTGDQRDRHKTHQAHQAH